jgi:chemotaxis protein methyltransferase CheR
MGDIYLEKIREHVFRRGRLYFSGHKKPVLRQRLDLRLQQLGLAGYRPYWEHLLREPAELRRLFELLTTNETSFFRNQYQFSYLREVVLPGLEMIRGQAAWRSLGQGGRPGERMKLRILCAGCSTGEEPYSMAMTLLEGLRFPRSWELEIIAGDLSESCLAVGRAGYYDNARLRGVPAPLLEKYFTLQPGGAVVRDELRRIVNFQYLNLAELLDGKLPAGWEGMSGFDIIFCRNVMIYFSPPCQQLLVETLSRLLAQGGYLLTGDAEPLHLFTHDLVTVPDAGCLIYQKREKVADAFRIA